MDEINELGKYLRRSKEGTKEELPIPSKGVNTRSMPWPMIGVMVVLEAVFVFLILFPFAWRATSAGVSLGMSMTMYLVTRGIAFAAILTFLSLVCVAACPGLTIAVAAHNGWVGGHSFLWSSH